ncbi:MAG: NBR1-Ig-like domain-containing protein [Anaerolineales bacterium]
MNRKIAWLLMAVSLLALSACGGAGATATPTVDTAPIYTEIASTALALQTQTVLAMPPTQAPPTLAAITNTPTSSLITGTPLSGTPADTPLPGTPSDTPIALDTPTFSQSSCDNMTFISDATIPDGYVAAPGEVMDKTWQIENPGPCTWTTGYKLAFGWGGVGTNWNTVKPVSITNSVVPGGTYEITIPLTAPTAKGVYGAFFRLENDKGAFFGPTLTIDISVN